MLTDVAYAVRQYDAARMVTSAEWTARETAINYLKARMPCDYTRAASLLADALARRASMNPQPGDTRP